MKTFGMMVVLAALLASPAVYADAPKIGYVDVSRAMNEVNAGKAAKAKLEADGQAKKKKLEILQNEFDTMRQDYEKQKLVLSGDALQKKQQALQQKLMDLQRTGAEFEKQFAEQEMQLTRPIAEKLKRIIAEQGQKGGYLAVLPKDIVLYGQSGNDLTDDVIKQFNSSK